MNYIPKYSKYIYRLALFFVLFIYSNSIMFAQFYSAKKDMKKMNVSYKTKPSEKISYSLDSLFITENDSVEVKILHRPLDEIEVTSYFGYRFHPVDKVYKNHSGIDLKGDGVFAYSISKGFVSTVGYNKGLGIHCVITIGGFEFTYGHLSQIYVKEGFVVEPGTILGLTGSTGKVTGPHLHLSVKRKGKYINPIEFLIYIENSEALVYN